ncbi:hypothetical protein N9Y42_10495 [Mariniblastus sp.]|nr:hypothetical protein [Mariniblastus sp.]
MKRNATLALSVVITCLAGCETATPPAASVQRSATETVPASRDQLFEPGLYESGDDYERLSNLLSSSSASIRLDAHSGIAWNSEAIGAIEDLWPLMKSASGKDILVITTGKAMWDKEDEYISEIVDQASAIGYKQTIVIDDHSGGIVVRKVMNH